MTIEEVWTKYYAIKSALDAQNAAFAKLELEKENYRAKLQEIDDIRKSLPSPMRYDSLSALNACDIARAALNGEKK